MKKSCRLPKGITEAFILEQIERVVRRISPDFTFGSQTLEDIQQEVRMTCWKAVFSFVGHKAALYQFFLVSSTRAMINLKRNNFSRSEPPCHKCVFFEPKAQHDCRAFAEKTDCERWALFLKSNKTKSTLADPAIEAIFEQTIPEEDVVLDAVVVNELRHLIDTKLDVKLRTDYLKLVSGAYLPTYRKEKLVAALKEILTEDMRRE